MYQIWYLLVCTSNSICLFALIGICVWGCIDLSGIICIFCLDVNTFCSHYKIEENVWRAWGLRLYCILCGGFATTRTGKHYNWLLFFYATYRSTMSIITRVFLQRQRMVCQLLRQKVHQRISVMKTNTGVFVVFKTKHDLKCQFTGNRECVYFHYWDSLMNFLM